MAAVLLLVGAARAQAVGVVVNEIFYNAPEDLDRVQWVELYNAGDAAADISGWTLDQGKVLTVPVGVRIPAGGFVVFALDRAAFTRAYGEAPAPAGLLKRPLKRGGEKLELRDAAGATVDTVRYEDKAPWPVSADGYAASLERICPGASGVSADNWAGSPLPDRPRPAGTPGRANAAFSATPPPTVVGLVETPVAPPGQPIAVTAEVRAETPLTEVSLLYRTVVNGRVGEEVAAPMERGDGDRWSARIPALQAGTLVRYRVQATATGGARRVVPSETDLRPAHSVYVAAPSETDALGAVVLLTGGKDREAAAASESEREAPPRPPRGASTLVVYEARTGKASLFDFIHAVARTNQPGTGFRVHFQKDRLLDGQSAISLIDEGSPRWLLSEAMAYDLYRRAGNAAPRTSFVRVVLDRAAPHLVLMVERPNRAFLRQNRIDPDGNLYKIRWYLEGLVGSHEKRTNTQTDHEDLKETVAELKRTASQPDAQWDVIRKRFDVDQVATHFAVNMVLSHWDGYFNNYFAYHDPKSDRWMLFPWDHDKAWGDDGLGGLLLNLPLTFARDSGSWFGPVAGKPGWWRPGGAFSSPLLSNPHFRKVFFAKIRAILATSFTEAVYGPLIDRTVADLGPEAARFVPAARSLKAFVTHRRAHLLAQPELKAGVAGAGGTPR